MNTFMFLKLKLCKNLVEQIALVLRQTCTVLPLRPIRSRSLERHHICSPLLCIDQTQYHISCNLCNTRHESLNQEIDSRAASTCPVGEWSRTLYTPKGFLGVKPPTLREINKNPVLLYWGARALKAPPPLTNSRESG